VSTISKKPRPAAIEPPIEPSATAHAVKFISRRELLSRVPLSYATIWNRMRERSFPLGRAVGERTFWLEHEIDEWIASRPKRELKGE